MKEQSKRIHTEMIVADPGIRGLVLNNSALLLAEIHKHAGVPLKDVEAIQQQLTHPDRERAQMRSTIDTAITLIEETTPSSKPEEVIFNKGTLFQTAKDVFRRDDAMHWP